ncbi:Immunoglobulin superfamily protein [Oopsacas minuta]|uniref:Immunoglobulin superfamily protein n=1 Tax=Oopsacas minuta TaxID=111878 RepID=A0AAV7JCD1_9METZ|nr:Immunoglobulin superfamily protein [Oopsacas minuta]
MLIIILLFSFLQFFLSQGYQLLNYPTDTIVKDGNKFNLECTFSDQPMKIHWLFNETLQPSNSSTLVITASPETAGYYQCIGYFELGTVVSEPALIQIGYILTTVDVPVDVVGSLGNWLLLSCEHVLSLPSADILWLEEDLFESPVTLTDSIEYLHNGSLLFSNLSLTDTGVYICLASNNYIQEFRRVTYNLTVSTGLSGIYSQLLFLIPEINIVSTGEDAIFQCLVDSSYLSALSWYYNDSPIPISTSYLIRDDGVTLVLKGPSTEASGEYMCVVDGLGSVSANLSVLDPPMVSISGSADIETNLESSFSLICVLEQGFTNVQWSWIKNGDPVNTTIFVGEELTVFYAQETDEGLYQCIASNEVGRDMKTFQVRVISYSPTFLSSEHLPSVIVFTYSPLSLNCSVDSVPAPEYSWTRDLIPLNDAITQGYFSTPAPGILVKNSLFKEDSGNYTCMVSNSVGSIQQSTYITILDGTRFIHEPSSGSFALAQDNYLVCEASVDEELSLSFNWQKDGIVLQTNNRVSYVSSQQGTLLFKDAQQSDTGEYQCIVEATDNNSGVIADSYLFSRLVSIRVLNVSAAPTDLTVTGVNDTSFTLSWISASIQPSSFFHIFISIQFMNGTVQTANSYQVEEPAFLTGLLPYTLYSIQVSGSVIGPKSQPPLQIRTKQAVPTSSPVGLYSFLIKEDSLMLKWEHPPERLSDGSGRNGKIVSYEISLSSQLISTRIFDNSSNYTLYQLTDLSPYTLYSVIVTAVGTEGRSPPSSSLLVRTLAAGL